MFQTRTKEDIIDALLFKNFTDFAEVLNFYWIAILWIILLLPLWVRMKWFHKLLTIGVFAVSGALLSKYFDFWGNWQIKAILVEYPKTFCFGQFQRGAIVLFGMFLGGLFLGRSTFKKDKFKIGFASIGIGLAVGAIFIFLTRESPQYRETILMRIAKNWGKHPPNLEFISFSLSGALILFGFSMIVPSKLTVIFKPFSLIGKEPFFCFNWHFILIFVIFRYLMDLRWDVSYYETLALFGVVFISSFLLSPINTYVKRKGFLWKWLLP